MRDLAALYLATGRAKQAEELLTKALAGDEEAAAAEAGGTKGLGKLFKLWPGKSGK